MVGGHYTCAEVPMFDWIKNAFSLDRNHYDRVGHLAQGFIPAMIAREILLRASPLKPGKWLFFIVVCVCMGISVVYEFIEWWVALANRGRGGGLSRYPGGRVGYPMGHGAGHDWCHSGSIPVG